MQNSLPCVESLFLLGIAFENAPDVVQHIKEHFEVTCIISSPASSPVVNSLVGQVWWDFVGLDSKGATILANDTEYHVQRFIYLFAWFQPPTNDLNLSIRRSRH